MHINKRSSSHNWLIFFSKDLLQCWTPELILDYHTDSSGSVSSELVPESKILGRLLLFFSKTRSSTFLVWNIILWNNRHWAPQEEFLCRKSQVSGLSDDFAGMFQGKKLSLSQNPLRFLWKENGWCNWYSNLMAQLQLNLLLSCKGRLGL